MIQSTSSLARTSSSNTEVLAVRKAYNLIANDYERWRWYAFWKANERPHVLKWLESRQGVGLDAGCGTAPYLAELANNSDPRIFLDISERMLAIAQKKVKRPHNKNLFFIQSNIAQLPLASDSVDFLLCTRVLSHSAQLHRPLREFFRTLKPRGEVFITDVHSSHPYENTRIEAKNGLVSIETYKHPVFEVVQTALSIGFSLVGSSEYGLRDLKTLPDGKAFSKIYANPHLPIFFSVRLIKS